MSLQDGTPPTMVPGYDPERLLGVGAYGEVWAAVDKNTGRRVAIKFYAHRGGLDWSLLAREVEKLAFLFADRYVVQLIGVGWDADPPYYIMEYLEQGSLAGWIQAGPLPVGEAVELFHDVALGLVHAHGKGVLHCDLKPANILLDQDGKPRLADFGQSRLSREQAPALGTLFYMAPEQADLKAVPDVRWDVYALGALLYCMLTGNPPHRTPQSVERLEAAGDLGDRLAQYRRMIRSAPPPAAHRQAPGVDRALAEIVDHCLAADPRQRFPNVQSVLAALSARARHKALRPVMILGAVGPALLLAVVSLFAWRGFEMAVRESEQALSGRALETNRFAAMYAARAAKSELERRYSAVEQVAGSTLWRQAVSEAVRQPELARLLGDLGNPHKSEAELEPLRRQFREHPARKKLQEVFEALIPARMRPAAKGETEKEEVASWFFCDTHGISTVRSPESETVGKDFAWRSFFWGGSSDRPRSWRPGPDEHVETTGPSVVFASQASGRWIVAISTPVYDDSPSRKFLGVVALTVEVGRFVELLGGDDPFAVLVDWRPGPHQGTMLQHPLYDALRRQKGRVPERFLDYRLTAADLPSAENPARRQNYRDPLAADAEGRAYRGHWLALEEPVRVRGREMGWRVIVQGAYARAIGATLDELRGSLVRYGLMAAAMVVAIVAGLWAAALRLLREGSPARIAVSPADSSERPAGSATPHGPTETH
jgi:hypothetical protein